MKVMIASRMTTTLSSATRIGLIYSKGIQPILKSLADGWDFNRCKLTRGMGGLASKPLEPKGKPHVKARCEVYPGSEVRRFKVPDDKVSWKVSFPAYKPVDHTAPSVLKQPPWADVDVRKEKTPALQWNKLDGNIDRRSHIGIYDIVNRCPRNPIGRTGVTGRGRLGRWGPNHAADPIVTRWKRYEDGQIVEKRGQPVAQFVAIQRKDSKEWAIPGGMVEAGEKVSSTLKREFGEEALNTLQVAPQNRDNIDTLFKHGTEIFRGYVDDPRNTDNTWMETVAMNFHDENDQSVGSIQLEAGDDAQDVQWMDIDSSLNLFASHTDFLQATALRLNASW